MDRGGFRPSLIDAATPGARLVALGEFLDDWAGPRREDYGVTDAELANHRLPMPLRWLHRFAGRWPDASGERPSPFVIAAMATQEYLLSLDHLEVDAAGRIAFASENQGNWTCRTLADGDDPPVWCDGDRITEDGWIEGEALVSDSLSSFLVTFALRELAFGARVSLDDDCLAARYRAEAGSAVPVWSAAPFLYGPGPSFHLWGDVLVMDASDGSDPTFAANAPAGVEWLEANQGAVGSAWVAAYPRWVLKVAADGSATLEDRSDPAGRELIAPPGTFGLDDLVAELRAGLMPGGHSELDATVHFFRIGQRQGSMGQHLRDPERARALFLRAARSAEVRDGSIERRLADGPLF